MSLNSCIFRSYHSRCSSFPHFLYLLHHVLTKKSLNSYLFRSPVSRFCFLFQIFCLVQQLYHHLSKVLSLSVCADVYHVQNLVLSPSLNIPTSSYPIPVQDDLKLPQFYYSIEDFQYLLHFKRVFRTEYDDSDNKIGQWCYHWRHFTMFSQKTLKSKILFSYKNKL